MIVNRVSRNCCVFPIGFRLETRRGRKVLTEEAPSIVAAVWLMGAMIASMNQKSSIGVGQGQSAGSSSIPVTVAFRPSRTSLTAGSLTISFFL